MTFARSRGRLAAAALLLALPLAARADTGRESPPPVGPPRPVVLPKTQDFVLDNGLQVTLVPFGEVPRASVALIVRAGNADAPRHQIAVPDLLAAFLKEGAGGKDAATLARQIAGVGGALDVSVSDLETRIASDVLSEHTAELVGILADVARRPALPESELARLRTDLARQLAIAKSQPQTLAAEEFRAVIYGDHPYGARLPSAEEVLGYTMDQVRRFYADGFGARRSHLYVVGRFDAAAVEAAARGAFAGWAPGTAPSLPPPKPASGRTVRLLDRPGAVQSTVRIGLPVVDPTSPDWIKLNVANAVLGGGFSSRITANIREAKGYTYSPFAAVDPELGAATWYEQADVKTDVTGAAIGEIVKETEHLAAEPPPAEELAARARYLSGVFVLQMAIRESILGQLAFVDRHGLPRDFLAEYVPRVNAVTPAEVQKTTATYLPVDKMAIVVVGDKKTVAKQLEPFRKPAAKPARKRGR